VDPRERERERERERVSEDRADGEPSSAACKKHRNEAPAVSTCLLFHGFCLVCGHVQWSARLQIPGASVRLARASLSCSGIART